MDNSQEVTVIHFLLGLCKQLDSIDESRYDLRLERIFWRQYQCD